MGQFNGSGISNLPITFRGVSGSFIFLPPGIHSSSLDLEGTSSIEFTEKSASFILETSLNRDLQFRIPSRSVGATQDIIPIYITSSGINPRVGIGTTNPLEALDFKDISDSARGINLLLRSARTTIGAQIGDSAGLINFVIDSSSFIDVESSGSIASIQSQVSDVDFSGVAGDLILSTAIGKSIGPIQRVKIGAVNTEITGTLKVSTDISSSGALHISGAESFIKTLRVGFPFPIGNNTLVASGPVSFIDSVTLGNSSSDKIAIHGMASITGSISASVDISASNTIFSKFITASLISASDKIDGSQIHSKGNTIGLFHVGSSTVRLGDTNRETRIYGNGISLQNSLTASAISASNIELTGNITASGNISASGNLLGTVGQFNQVTINGEVALSTTDSATTGRVFADTQITKIKIGKAGSITSTLLESNVTASGNISASGDIFCDNITVASDITSVGDDIILKDNLVVSSSAGSITFRGTAGGSNESITYLDSGGSGRFAMLFPGQDTVAITNRASDGIVQIRANTSTAGSGGEVTVAQFEDDSATFNTNITASGHISASGDLISNTLDTKTNKLAVTSTVHGNHQGDVVFFGGTTSMDVGQIYNLNSGGGWTKAQANSQANSDALLAVALGDESDNDGMLLKGMVTLDHDPGTFGDPLYLSDGAAGQATSTAPNSTNDIVRLIGYCVDSTNGQIYFNPSNDFIKHA